MTGPKVLSGALASIGVAGLDTILRGGLPRDRLYLIDGDPGTGKTTLALQFLMEGRASNGEVLYVTLSETSAQLQAVASSRGWTQDGITLYELRPATRPGCRSNSTRSSILPRSSWVR